jgi:hypothetical protein
MLRSEKGFSSVSQLWLQRMGTFLSFSSGYGLYKKGVNASNSFAKE